ncbi:MAG: enoyl-CoA hydratase/isomerase family protein [Chloroflexi bacterium]|nr:enoyl-CoA hydratase/isomerase family protein [Chloroflexota bacterium]
MEFQAIIYQKEDSIARITLNRPRVLNAYNMRMRDDLFEALGAISDDPEVRAVIISGAGEKAFCAGADLTEFLTAPPPVKARQARWERDVWGRFLSIKAPVIAALHGYVLGSGVEIALCCDVRLAAEDARFGLPEGGLGIIPAAGGSQTLPRAVGPAAALDILLSGRLVTAGEALKLRLVNRVVPRDALFAAASGMARRIASYPPLAVELAKAALARGLDKSLAEGLELERRLAARLTAGA